MISNAFSPHEEWFQWETNDIYDEGGGVTGDTLTTIYHVGMDGDILGEECGESGIYEIVQTIAFYCNRTGVDFQIFRDQMGW